MSNRCENSHLLTVLLLGVFIAVPSVHAEILTFQQGVSGYGGSRDTSIRWAFEANYFMTPNADGTFAAINSEGPHASVGAYEYLSTNGGVSSVLEVGQFFNKPIGFAGRAGPIYRFSRMAIRFRDLIGTSSGQVPPDATITNATLKLYNTYDLGAAGASSGSPDDPGFAKEPQLNQGLIQLSPMLVPIVWGTSDGAASKGESTGRARRRGRGHWWSRGETCGYPDTPDDPFIAETSCGPVPAGSPPATDPGGCYGVGCLGYGNSGIGTTLWGRHWVIADGFEGDYDPTDLAAVEVFQDAAEGFKEFDVTPLVIDGRISQLGVYLTALGNEPATLEKNFGQAYRSSEFGGANPSPEDLATRPILVVEFEPMAIRLPGDASGDGIMDVVDLGIVGANFNLMGVEFGDGDFNDDGVVDVADLAIVGANWSAAKGSSNLQTHYLSGADQTVPEPTSMAVMALGSVLLLRLNRQVA
tara:strand:+ start:195 stop:1607 length:1413 start_codon:yes stop_codon:yes gene_type:complete